MTGGELATLAGDLFYVTNTDCTIELSGVVLTPADGCLLRVDGISSLELTLSDGTTFEGTINPDGQGGEVHVTLAGGCRWRLTADAYVTSFTGDLSCVETNGYTLYTAQQAAVEGV